MANGHPNWSSAHYKGTEHRCQSPIKTLNHTIRLWVVGSRMDLLNIFYICLLEMFAFVLSTLIRVYCVWDTKSSDHLLYNFTVATVFDSLFVNYQQQLVYIFAIISLRPLSKNVSGNSFHRRS